MSNLIASEIQVINNPAATLAAKIAAAATLWNLIEQCESALKPFKDEVRVVAQQDGRSSVTLNGDGMTQCKVVLPGPTVKLKDGLSVEGERGALGELFHTVYDVKLSLRNTSPTFIATLPHFVQAHLGSVATVIASTPRVSLKILPGVTDIAA
jgi:hypothetical protein